MQPVKDQDGHGVEGRAEEDGSSQAVDLVAGTVLVAVQEIHCGGNDKGQHHHAQTDKVVELVDERAVKVDHYRERVDGGHECQGEPYIDAY